MERDFGFLFTAADQAAGARREEIEVALRDGIAEDTRWHVHKKGHLFWANGLTVPVDEPEVRGLVKIFRDETPARQAEEQRILLLNELNHRVKNTLATVQSVTEQTLRAAGVEKDVRTSLSDRLMALSQAHNVLVAQSWAGADLRAVVGGALNPHDRSPAVVELEGPSVRLSPALAVGFSLVLHELATNAAKYGALSVSGGSVRISWNEAVDGTGVRHLTLLWRERDGPEVRPPTHQGFGTRLIQRALSGCGADVRTEFQPQGLCCVIETALPDGGPDEFNAALSDAHLTPARAHHG
jgi:two-component sensor histidine kinase